MAFSLVQWQYKAEASGSRAFRLKSVHPQTRFCKGHAGRTKKYRTIPDSWATQKMRLRMVHYTKFKRYTAILRAAVPLSWWVNLPLSTPQCLKCCTLGYGPGPPSDQQANQEEQQRQFHAKQGAAWTRRAGHDYVEPESASIRTCPTTTWDCSGRNSGACAVITAVGGVSEFIAASFILFWACRGCGAGGLTSSC